MTVSHEPGRCEWQHSDIPDYACPEPALPSGRCIFHEWNEKDAEAFKAELQRKLDDHDFDFTGYYFPDGMSFEGQHFDGDTCFRYAKFLGRETSFAKALFSGEKTSFEGVKFSSSGTDFSNAEFSGGETCFSSAIFSGNVTDFRKAKFSSVSTTFHNAWFKIGSTLFTEALFSGDSTLFTIARFSGDMTIFTSAQFASKVTGFFSARFASGWTHFGGAEFSGETALFTSARFLSTEIDFGHARFSCETIFQHVQFSGERTSFVSAEFLGPKADLRSTRFLSTRTDFSFCRLGPCSLIDTEWRKMDFTGAAWNSLPGRPDVCCDEMDAETPEDYAAAARICRNIKLAYHETGDYERAGEFFYGEMECTRKTNSSKPMEWWWLTLLKHVCGYGERPGLVVKRWVQVVCVFAAVYSFLGIEKEGATVSLWYARLPVKDFLLHLWRCVYFSAVTFTTLGYGDIRPAGLSQFFAALEASLGAFLMALFILVVGRKMLR